MVLTTQWCSTPFQKNRPQLHHCKSPRTSTLYILYIGNPKKCDLKLVTLNHQWQEHRILREWEHTHTFYTLCTTSTPLLFLRSYERASWYIPSEWNQQTHWIPILLVLCLYMFRAVFLPIIRGSYLYISIGTFLQIWWLFATRSRMALIAILLPVANGQQICKNVPMLMYG